MPIDALPAQISEPQKETVPRRQGPTHEALDEDRGGMVVLGPVSWEAADDGEDAGAGVGDVDPGEDEEPGVVDDQGFFSRRCGVQAMKPPRGAGFHAAVLKPRTATGGSVTVVHGVAQPGAGQGLLADMAVAGDELVPQPPLARAARHRAPLEGADLVGGGREPGRFGAGSEDDGLGRCCRPQGGGSTITPSRCMATRAIMPLRPPSGLSRPMHRQNSWTTRRGSAVDRRRSGRAAAPSHGW